MESHRETKTASRREEFHRGSCARLPREPEAYPGHAREEGMRERRDHATHDEDGDRPARFSSGDRFAIIKNVLGHREAESNHGGVENAIEYVVELVALPEVKDEE